MNKNSFDVIIIGGGLMGCSTGYHLTYGDPEITVCIVERDFSYQYASTPLSIANIRVQFSLKENIQISMYTHEILKHFEEQMTIGDEKPSISYRREGNLFLADDLTRTELENSMNQQKDLGCVVEWLEEQDIRDRFPLYGGASGLAGVFSPNDGHLDPHAFLMAYKAKAKSQGVELLNDEVVEIMKQGNQAIGVKLSSGEKLRSKVIINCAGPWAAQIAKTVGIELPIHPFKQEIYVVNPATRPDVALPFTYVIPTDLWLRSELLDLVLVGSSFQKDKPTFDFNWSKENFMENIWPRLAEFAPSFDTLKLQRGYAGLYAVNTLDDNAILGEWPELKGLILANGFSGHGLQQAPAVGRYISELVLGKKPKLDLSIFGPERILENRALAELGVI